MQFHEGWLWLAVAIISGLIALLSNIRSIGLFAAAALSSAGLAAVVVTSLWLQLALFVFVFLILIRWYLKHKYVPQPANLTVNMKKHVGHIVGTNASLLRGINSGKGKVQIRDAVWTVNCDTKLAAGSMVQVVGYHGIELEVKPTGKA